MVLFQSSCNSFFHTWQFITVFSIQEPLHSKKIMSQIPKEAFENREF